MIDVIVIQGLPVVKKLNSDITTKGELSIV